MEPKIGDLIQWRGRTCRIVAIDTSPEYNASRKPWYLQVRPVDGSGWLAISLAEWNGEAQINQGNTLDVAC